MLTLSSCGQAENSEDTQANEMGGTAETDGSAGEFQETQNGSIAGSADPDLAELENLTGEYEYLRLLAVLTAEYTLMRVIAKSMNLLQQRVLRSLFLIPTIMELYGSCTATGRVQDLNFTIWKNLKELIT